MCNFYLWVPIGAVLYLGLASPDMLISKRLESSVEAGAGPRDATLGLDRLLILHGDSDKTKQQSAFYTKSFGIMYLFFGFTAIILPHLEWLTLYLPWSKSDRKRGASLSIVLHFDFTNENCRGYDNLQISAMVNRQALFSWLGGPMRLGFPLIYLIIWNFLDFFLCFFSTVQFYLFRNFWLQGEIWRSNKKIPSTLVRKDWVILTGITSLNLSCNSSFQSFVVIPTNYLIYPWSCLWPDFFLRSGRGRGGGWGGGCVYPITLRI